MAYTFPKPTGRFSVGIIHTSFTYNFVDEKREIPLYIYYPSAEEPRGRPFPYGRADLFAENPNAAEMAATVTQCYSGLRASPGKHPLTLFNPGYGCYTMFNTVLCSDLASEGFVVAAVGHPGDCTVLYPDGRSGGVLKAHVDEMMNEPRNNTLAGFIPRFDELGDSEKCIELGREFFENQPFFNARLIYWNADNIAVLDWLQKYSADVRSPLSGSVDWSLGASIGGHSYGGATAVDVARFDRRIVCGVNIDGGNFGYHYAEDIAKPFLSIGNPHIWGMLMGYTKANTADSYFVRVGSVEHMDFTDFPHMGSKLGTRDLNSLRMTIRDCYLGFLRTYQTRENAEFVRPEHEDTWYFEKRS